MNYVYHGSTKQNLKIINKSVLGAHQNEYVYASEDKAIAIAFINNHDGDLLFDLGIFLDVKGSASEPLVIVERKAGMFKKVYNLSGSLYLLDAKNFVRGKTKWDSEVVSAENEVVIREEYIENVSEKLNELHNNHEIQLFNYPHRPASMPLDSSDLIPLVIKWHQKGLKGIIPKFLELYPELEIKLTTQLD